MGIRINQRKQMNAIQNAISEVKRNIRNEKEALELSREQGEQTAGMVVYHTERLDTHRAMLEQLEAYQTALAIPAPN